MIIIAYIPVIHRGYLDFLDEFKESPIHLISNDVIDYLSDRFCDNKSLNAIKRDIRKIKDEDIMGILKSIYPDRKIDVLDRNILIGPISFCNTEILMPYEDVSMLIKKTFFDSIKMKISFYQTFLRWDLPKSLSKLPLNESREVTTSQMIDRDLMSLAGLKASHSPDWWRQVGAVLVKDGNPILWAFNKHMLTEFETYFSGDPRSNFNAGEHIELSKASHAEANLIASCAQKGISTKGASIYVTTFPCPACSYLILNSGIKKVYFKEGYSLVGSADDLKSSGIELIRVI